MRRPPVAVTTAEVANYKTPGINTLRFDIVPVRAEIADIGKGERYHLPGITGIRQDLLIARDRW